MSDATLRILRLLEAGKITSKEAEDLLSALDRSENDSEGSDAKFWEEFSTDKIGERIRNSVLRELHHENGIMPNPGQIVSSVMKEVNPGKIIREAMRSVRSFPIPKATDMLDRCLGSHSAEEEQLVVIPAEGINTVSLNQPRSRIKATGIDSDQIVIRSKVQVFGDDEDEAQERLKSLKVTAETENGVLRIKLEGPPWTKKRRAQVDFEIEVPQNLALELETASGEIEVCGIKGGAKLQSASGEITLDGCSGTIEVSTASGDISLANCTAIEAMFHTASGDVEVKGSGDISVQSVSGNVFLALEAGKVSVTTVSGDLELEAGSLDGLSASTTSGDTSIKLKSAPHGDIRLVSISGDVTLELPDDASTSIEVSTTSGDIDCRLELAEINRTRRWLSGRLGSGRVAVSVKTTSGDITIK